MNEVIFGKHLRIEGLVARGLKFVRRGLELSVPHLDLRDKEKDRKVNQ